MDKMINKSPDVTLNSEAENGYPVPFTIESLREDILNLYLHQLRTLGWVAGADAVWKLIDKKSDVESHDVFTDMLPEDFGLKYQLISNTSFARSIEQMYQFAYYGIVDISADPFENESIHMWVSAILSDMHHSDLVEEWDNMIGTVGIHTARCLQVAELANARNVLEGADENFFRFHSGNQKADATGEGCLTIRQMALLAGMEEMSIRAAANPKRVHPLLTYSESGQTRIAIEVAKDWLIKKGRYVNVRRVLNEGELDLSVRGFKSVEDLMDILSQRCKFIESKGSPSLMDILYKNNILTENSFYSGLSINELHQTEKLEFMAKVLELNPVLFELRVKEVLAREVLASTEREIQKITKTH